MYHLCLLTTNATSKLAMSGRCEFLFFFTVITATRPSYHRETQRTECHTRDPLVPKIGRGKGCLNSPFMSASISGQANSNHLTAIISSLIRSQDAKKVKQGIRLSKAMSGKCVHLSLADVEATWAALQTEFPAEASDAN